MTTTNYIIFISNKFCDIARLVVVLVICSHNLYAQVDTSYHIQGVTINNYLASVGMGNLNYAAEKFNLNEDELQTTWQSIPEKLQTSIISTLLYRSKVLARLAQENHPSC